ncbi:HAD-IB family phosphatase [Arenimonas sp.]|uniref:HAD-IB family phosphatase n=1 Tax=Arenimonas sp. TaxID=1872635 RepID=UPI0039E4609C
MKFIFDLDGTISRHETLPIMAARFGIQDRIDALTEETIRGNVPFIESFIRRVGILGQYPVSEMNRLLADVELFAGVIEFIRRNSADCIIATGNLRPWIEGLCRRIDCQVCCSEATIVDDRVTKLTSILRKEDIVRHWQSQGETVVFIGDGNNDAEAMRQADVAVATGLVHWPARSVLDVADFAVFDESALLRLLEQLRTTEPEPGSNTLVLSCAGLGSRLGLNSTKALINFEQRPFVQWQLDGFRDVEDIRVVVGFQARDVIQAVRAVRNDAVFVFNHDYFSTGTGQSLYLGSRYANEYVIAWDGDLVVHHESLASCLQHKGEYLGVSEAVTEEAVFAQVDERTDGVVGFTREHRTPYEWSGPARLISRKVANVRGNVFEGLIDRLPIPALHVRAFDIDTVADYHRAQENFRSYIGEQ